MHRMHIPVLYCKNLNLHGLFGLHDFEKTDLVMVYLIASTWLILVFKF